MNRQILFLSSSPVDEVWTRSTALACHLAGLSIEVAICGDCTSGVGLAALKIYQGAGVPAEGNLSLNDAARKDTLIAITASSGLDRAIFPTNAGYFVHMPHSLVSLHMIYPDDAFDGYDVLFAAGPQHIVEFSAIAKLRGLSGAEVFQVGYGKLDVLFEETGRRSRGNIGERPAVLIAPSWGEYNLLDLCGVELAEACIAAGYQVVVRPHPLFFVEDAPVLSSLMSIQHITIESPFSGDNAIFEADLLIGDYSGIGFEYSALRRRAVVSVDVGRKIANPNWHVYGLEPVEISHRGSLGPIVSPSIPDIMGAVEWSVRENAITEDSTLESFLFLPPGSCGEKALVCLKALLERSA